MLEYQVQNNDNNINTETKERNHSQPHTRVRYLTYIMLNLTNNCYLIYELIFIMQYFFVIYHIVYDLYNILLS